MDDSTRTRRANGQFETGWTSQEDAILRANIHSKTYRELVELLPARTRGAICSRAKLIGVRDGYQPDRKPDWSDEELSILRSNLSRLSYPELAKILPRRTVHSIKRRADIIGLPRQKKIGPTARRTLDEGFFGKQDLHAAYWAGFIAADGCVVRHPRNEVKIGLHYKDRGQLERFCRDTQFDGPITTQRQMVRITVCSAHCWLWDLELIYNIGPAKTKTLQPPNVTGRMALAYIVGYIDGDGCWAVLNRRRGYRMLNLLGTYEVLTWMVETLRENGASVGNVSVLPYHGVYKVTFQCSHAVTIARLLDSLPIEKMERKWRVARGESDGQERSSLED